MPKTKIVLTLNAALLDRFDELVVSQRFRNRSQAFEAVMAEKLGRLGRSQLARECAKLDPAVEKALSEGGFVGSPCAWLEY